MEEVKPVAMEQTPAQPTAQPQTPAVAQTVTPTPTPARRELTPEEKQFLDALTELVTSAQELSYALAALDASIVTDNPEIKELFETARNVVRAVWRFHKLVKARMRVG